MSPRYSILVRSSSHFSGRRQSLCSCRHSRTIRRIWRCSSRLSVKIRMSSRYMRTCPSMMRPWKISFIMVWNVTGLLVSPNDKRFKEATVCVKGSLPLITILYPYIVEPPSHIQLGEVFCISELGNEFQNDWKRVAIFHHHGIENTIVLDQSQQPILLFDEEHWASHGRFQRVNMTSAKVFFQEFVQLQLFTGRE